VKYLLDKILADEVTRATNCVTETISKKAEKEVEELGSCSIGMFIQEFFFLCGFLVVASCHANLISVAKKKQNTTFVIRAENQAKRRR
jgi:hypothetical protein